MAQHAVDDLAAEASAGRVVRGPGEGWIVERPRGEGAGVRGPEAGFRRLRVSEGREPCTVRRHGGSPVGGGIGGAPWMIVLGVWLLCAEREGCVLAVDGGRMKRGFGAVGKGRLKECRHVSPKR